MNSERQTRPTTLNVGLGVSDAVAVGVRVLVVEGVAVEVGELVAVGVAVGEGVADGVDVVVGVAVGEGVGVTVTQMLASPGEGGRSYHHVPSQPSSGQRPRAHL